jgi:hypothetical protein
MSLGSEQLPTNQFFHDASGEFRRAVLAGHQMQFGISGASYG